MTGSQAISAPDSPRMTVTTRPDDHARHDRAQGGDQPAHLDPDETGGSSEPDHEIDGGGRQERDRQDRPPLPGQPECGQHVREHAEAVGDQVRADALGVDQERRRRGLARRRRRCRGRSAACPLARVPRRTCRWDRARQARDMRRTWRSRPTMTATREGSPATTPSRWLSASRSMSVRLPVPTKPKAMTISSQPMAFRGRRTTSRNPTSAWQAKNTIVNGSGTGSATAATRPASSATRAGTGRRAPLLRPRWAHASSRAPRSHRPGTGGPDRRRPPVSAPSSAWSVPRSTSFADPLGEHRGRRWPS